MAHWHNEKSISIKFKPEIEDMHIAHTDIHSHIYNQHSTKYTSIHTYSRIKFLLPSSEKKNNTNLQRNAYIRFYSNLYSLTNKKKQKSKLTSSEKKHKCKKKFNVTNQVISVSFKQFLSYLTSNYYTFYPNASLKWLD